MKTADEMFEELGYEKALDDDFSIEYKKVLDGDLFEINLGKGVDRIMEIDTKALIGIMQQIDSAYKEYEGTYCNHRGKGTKMYLTKRIDILREELLNLKKSLN